MLLLPLANPVARPTPIPAATTIALPKITQEAVDLPLHSSRELSTSTPLTVLTPLQAARLRLAATMTLMFKTRHGCS